MITTSLKKVSVDLFRSSSVNARIFKKHRKNTEPNHKDMRIMVWKNACVAPLGCPNIRPKAHPALRKRPKIYAVHSAIFGFFMKQSL